MVRFLKIFVFFICIFAATKRVYTPVLVFETVAFAQQKTEAVNCL